MKSDENPLGPEKLARIFKPLKKNPRLIGTKESVTVEYKLIFEKKKIWKYAKTICAFANRLGGYLVFGIKDKPHELVGMDDESLKGFNSLDPGTLSTTLTSYFSPDIRFDMYVHDFGGKFFGIIYTYESSQKPILCKKNKSSDENPGKSYLEEGVIYYRYGGSSKKIRYEELSAIIQEERDKVHEQWRRTLGQITSSGLEKVSVLDLESKALISEGTPVYIDEGLASQLSFVKEGHFVDNGGSPTLMLKGTVETAGSAKPILIPKQVPTSINDTEIFEAFLTSEGVSSPELYIKQICFQTSGNLPVYYFMQQAGLSAQETLNLLNETNRNSRARETLEKRLTEGNTAKGTLGQATTRSGKMKQYYHDRICHGQSASPSNPNELKYYLSAIRGMDNSEIRQFRDVVLEALYSIFKNYLYKDDYKIIIQEFRYACCWLDEVLYSE